MNIGDIAELAGVSRAAVSRYLNNGYISDEKRERIRRVIEETHYQPSLMARTLRTKKTRLIGVILPRINSDSISSVVEGIGSVLHKENYHMLLASADNDPARELEFLRIFSNDRVDGIILAATVLTDEHRSLLEKMQIPVVIVGQQLEGQTSICHDDYGAGKALARLLLERGRRRIGFIGVLREDVAVGQRRFEGFRDELLKAGLRVSENMKETADFSVVSGCERMRCLHASFPEMDAVICATDQIALGAINYLKEQGLCVPKDLAVAGFGDNLLSSYTTPSITSVHFYYRQSGERAAMELLSDLEEERRSPRSICLGYELIMRESV